MTPRQIAGIAYHDQQVAEFWTALREAYRADPCSVKAMASDATDYLVRLAAHADGNEKQDAALAGRLGLVGVYQLFEKIAEWDAEESSHGN